jgi:hypothetical protein
MKKLVLVIVLITLLVSVGVVAAQDPMPVPGSGGIPRQFGDGAFLNDTEPTRSQPSDDTYYFQCHWIPDHTRPNGGTFECWWTKFPDEYQP